MEVEAFRPHMNIKIRSQLSVMMFMQFFVWGVWFVTMGTYLFKLGFAGSDIGDAYSTNCLGAIIAPFIVGMIADKFFSAQKLMGFLHIAGGAVLYYASTVTQPGPLFWVLLVYAALYMPTLALVNAVSFHQMKDPGSQFPGVRVWGTIGWIAAGTLVGLVLKPGNPDIESTSVPMVLGAAVSVVLGLYSFFLPSTPPKSAGKKVTVRDVLGLDALALMKDRSFAVLVVCSLLISIPLAFYYNFTNAYLNETKVVANPAFSQTFGQWSELGFMILMPFFFRRLGIKKLMLLGMLAWTARYALFAMGASGTASLVYLGILAHGVCYDFFFVTGQIYVDKKAPKHLQGSAQGFIAMATYGVGMWIGSIVSGKVVEAFTNADGTHRWGQLWYVPSAMALGITILFALVFKDDFKADEGKSSTAKDNRVPAASNA
jgi:nucleoside transporter